MTLLFKMYPAVARSVVCPVLVTRPVVFDWVHHLMPGQCTFDILASVFNVMPLVCFLSLRRHLE